MYLQMQATPEWVLEVVRLATKWRKERKRMLSRHLLPMGMIKMTEVDLLMELVIMARRETQSRQGKALHTNFTKEVRESRMPRNARQIRSLRTGAGRQTLNQEAASTKHLRTCLKAPLTTLWNTQGSLASVLLDYNREART